MTAPDAAAMHRLLDGLEPAIRTLWGAACARIPADARRSIVVAGTRAGVRNVIPHHHGDRPFAAALYARDKARARLAAIEEPEAAELLGQAHDPDRIDVVLVTAGALMVVELHRVPDATSPGGST